MTVDAHQHFWEYDAGEYPWIDDSMAGLRRNFLPHDSAPAMAAEGFAACVAVQARQTLEETRWLIGLAETHTTIAGVVGWVDLQAGAENVRAQLRSFGGAKKLVGLRHIVQSEPDDRFLVRPNVLEGLAVLAEFGLAFDILIYAHQLPAACECVEQLPEVLFVLDHLAKPQIRSRAIQRWEDDLRAVAAHGNVYAKLSGLITEADWHGWTADDIEPYLDVAFDAFGWQRLMVGSDWPVCLVAGDYSRTMHVVVDYIAGRTPLEREAVLGGNARRFWKLQ
jgi:L-fucono-1,5-lactonase